MNNPVEKSDPVAWPLGSYAPGMYTCSCMTCGEAFMGDKRALCCLECSVIRLKAENAALLSQVEWRPIETAPKGERGIAWMMLAYGPPGDQTVGMGMRFHDQYFAASTFYVGGRFDTRQFAFKEHEVFPTHWMPSPNPPAALQEKKP